MYRAAALAPALLVTAAAVLVACGQDKGTSTAPLGVRLSAKHGCAACHGPHGEGGVGPKWQGLYGSTVTLNDGSQAVVDRAYLVRAIEDPDAQIPKGYTTKMPKSNLSDADLQALVDYIISLK